MIWGILSKKNLQPILDYVEGRMSATEFQHLFETDKTLQNTLKKRMRQYSCYREYGYNLYNMFKNDYDYKNRNWDTISCRSALQGELTRLLDEYGISYKEYKKYDQEYYFLLDIQPSWVDCRDDSILVPLIESIPNNLSKTKRIAMGKEKIRALFRYDKTYPRWIQEAEWPIVNGKPLVFSHQERIKGDDWHVLYYFYDPDTKEQTVVEQFS